MYLPTLLLPAFLLFRLEFCELVIISEHVFRYRKIKAINVETKLKYIF